MAASDAPLDINALERDAREDLTGDYPWPQVLSLIARFRASEAREREAWIAGRDAACAALNRSDSLFAGMDAMCALQPPEGSL